MREVLGPGLRPQAQAVALVAHAALGGRGRRGVGPRAQAGAGTGAADGGVVARLLARAYGGVRVEAHPHRLVLVAALVARCRLVNGGRRRQSRDWCRLGRLGSGRHRCACSLVRRRSRAQAQLQAQDPRRLQQHSRQDVGVDRHDLETAPGREFEQIAEF